LQCKFTFINKAGREISIPNIEVFNHLVDAGDIQEDSQLFDELSRAWKTAREVKIELNKIEPVNKYFKRLGWSLLLWCLLYILMALVVSSPSHDSTLLFRVFLLLLAVLMFSSAITFYVMLGKLALCFGRSIITWVGLTILTSPFGPFIAYFRMRSLIRAQRV